MSITICISSWSLRDSISNSDMTLIEVAETMVEKLNIVNIDLFDGHFHNEIDLIDFDNPNDQAKKIRSDFDRIGVNIIGISAANDFSWKDATNDIDRLKLWLEVGSILGTKFIRVNTGDHWIGRKSDGQIRFAVKELTENLEGVLSSGTINDIKLVIENHPFDIPIGNAGELYIDSMRQVTKFNTEVLDLCADDGHIEWEKPDDWICTLKYLLPHTAYFHVKCGNAAFRKNEQPATWKERVQLWKSIGYSGYITLEYVDNESGDKAWSVLQDAVNEIRKWL